MDATQDSLTSNGTNGTHDADTLVKKGLELFKQQKFLDALPLYEKAIEANASHYLAWYNKGIVSHIDTSYLIPHRHCTRYIRSFIGSSKMLRENYTIKRDRCTRVELSRGSSSKIA